MAEAAFDLLALADAAAAVAHDDLRVGRHEQLQIQERDGHDRGRRRDHQQPLPGPPDEKHHQRAHALEYDVEVREGTDEDEDEQRHQKA